LTEAGSVTSTSPDPRSGLPALLPLAVLAGISPLATDLYIPGLPALAAELGTDAGTAQLSLTTFLVAFAVGQLVIGPVSDAIGRRRVLLVGVAVFALSAVMCALAPSVAVLLLGRLLQGLAGACGSIAARAMVTDVLTGARRARMIGSLAAVNAVGPVVAPLVGGVLMVVGTWRSTFWLLVVIGVVLWGWAAATFPETLPPERRAHGVGLAANTARMTALLRIPRLSLYLATSCLATIGFFAYIATSSFVFQTYYGYSESAYSVVFATNAACMIVTTLVFRAVVHRVSEDRLLSLGLLVGAAAALAVLGCAWAGAPGAAVWACLAVVTGANGFIITASATRTQALGSASPGTAAALQGGLSFGLGGLGSPLAGLLGGSPAAMGAVMAVGLGLAAVLQTVVPRLLAPPVGVEVDA
jgi:DHA1 family bicyclomycin/chloramphenicol resistance-like MFS transporter